MALDDSRATTLAGNPLAMARAVSDLETLTKYLVYAFVFIAFVLWLMLNSRR